MTESTIQELACCVCSIVQVNKQRRREREKKREIKLTRDPERCPGEEKRKKRIVYIKLARTQGHTESFFWRPNRMHGGISSVCKLQAIADRTERLFFFLCLCVCMWMWMWMYVWNRMKVTGC